MSPYRVQKVEEVTLLFSAGGQSCPHAFVIALTGFAASPLSDQTIDYALADLLFVVIIDPEVPRKRAVG